MVKLYDTIIIGAGIAGLTAAIYASRERRKFEVLSADFGGQFLESGEVYNYPGIVETTGVEFSSIMEEQMKFNNIKVKEGRVKRIEKKGNDFKVITNKKNYDTRTVIIATGARPRYLGIPGETDFSNKGLTYCAICDGPLFQGMDVAVIGGGDSALEAVHFMENIVSKIYLMVLGEKLVAHEYLKEYVLNNKKVKIIYNAKTNQILGNKFLTGIRYEQKGKLKELKVKGVIVEIGRVPNTEFAKDIVKLDKHNHVEIDCYGNTSVPGIFAAGDCASGHEYQFVIAGGQGCMALIKAMRYLARQKGG
ncbi:FAD-dependent oxidoreductase [Candidatus Woesearchaeota archaeon]|nr:FAD-dependent oxidoreductase [Candidatus Woesearchaeota archaeon]